jgi:hypothetical protein
MSAIPRLEGADSALSRVVGREMVAALLKRSEPKSRVRWLGYISRKSLLVRFQDTVSAGYGRIDQSQVRYSLHAVKCSLVAAEFDDPEHPRGRVVYKPKASDFTLFADRCILREKKVVRKILAEMNLPKEHRDG